jgi:uncharacterized damage-inducible protein DinB
LQGDSVVDLWMLRDLFQHMEWADALVWQSVLAVPDLATDSVLRERLFHIHLVQRGFLLLWREPLSELPGPPTFLDAAALASWGRQYHQEVAAYMGAVDQTALDESVSIPWADHIAARFGRPAAATTLAQTMLQVTSHSTHHRGQVNTRLREVGGDPPLTDFIVWIWLGKPTANWPVLHAHADSRGV